MTTTDLPQYPPDAFGFAPPRCPLSFLMGADDKGGLVIRALHGGKLGLTHGDLILAAPAMYEALQQAAAAIPTTHGAFETVRVALAKAAR